ncbi:type II toxin-antitoxin system RelE/ParE family toxin [Bradyrhizobium sp. RDT10]
MPGNRLEALRGDRAGQFSIRINDQWRICFARPDGMPGRDRRPSLRKDHRASHTCPSWRTSGRRVARTWLECCRAFASD